VPVSGTMGGMAKITAVVYDVDGTLINSEPLHVDAWKSALMAEGCSLESLSSEFLETMAGNPQ
jgi:beta-phosphoglucomutase-like phosphatase (HAD superfamily)